MKYIIVLLSLLLVNSEVIQLPEPRKSGGLPLNEALSQRKSIKEFSDSGELTLEELSQLLWACYGINRPDTGYKTVPSSKAYFPFDVYVFMKTGVYLYDPVKHDLTLYKSEDLREITGGDPFVPHAYANLCLFGLYSRVPIHDVEVQRMDMELDGGYATQNMYFVAATEGFHAVTRANFNIKTLVETMGFSLNDVYVPLCFSAGR